MSATFVYAVVPASLETPDLTGLGEPPAAVRVIRTAALGAVVSDVPDEPPPGTRADVEAHAGVVSALVERGATMIPVRFGMVFPSDDAVRDDLLGRDPERLLELMEALRDRVQVTVKAVDDEEALLRDVAAADPRVTELSALTRGRADPGAQRERIELGERVALGIERLRAGDEGVILDRLDKVAERVIAEEPRHERIVVHAQLLVRRDRLGELEAAIRELDESGPERVAVRAVGPLAPWSFVDVRLEEAQTAWA